MKKQPPFRCHAVYPESKSKRCWFNSGHKGHHETTFYGRIVTWPNLTDVTRPSR